MLTDHEIERLSETYRRLWPNAKQNPDANADITYVWRKVCGDNSIEACVAALRRHAASSKFPARPGDLNELLPARIVKTRHGPTEAEKAAYIAEANRRMGELVDRPSDEILLAWECVKWQLSSADREVFGVEYLDPLRYHDLHPDLQYRLHFACLNLRHPGYCAPWRLWRLAANVDGLQDWATANVSNPSDQRRQSLAIRLVMGRDQKVPVMT